ncbi:hypothetical protein F5Y13DRAFT_173096 [Hypoxylon sp. FL1857]|nr:hypothetical protein F5Y13DRAFT_173096 [Hypoxylon sp. FL1857]
MGWMWSSQSSPSKGPNSTTDESNKPAKQPESDYGDPEIAKFFAQIQAEFNDNKPADQAQAIPSPESGKTTATTPTSAQPKSSWSFFGSKPTPEPTTTPSSLVKPPIQQTWTPERLDPLSESLLPTTMSCQQAFDAAYHCNSLGGQWTSVYRSGSVRSCSEHWDDFWFCMRTRAYSSPQKEEAIKDHYRKREYAKYFAAGRASSTDVWEPRTEKVEPGSAFREPLEMPNVSDEEWRRLEIERRRRVQELLKSRES